MAQNECAICLDPISAQPNYTLPCGHQDEMHIDCLAKWVILGSGNNRSCPKCRSPLNMRVVGKLSSVSSGVIAFIASCAIFASIYTSRKYHYPSGANVHNALFSLTYTLVYWEAVFSKKKKGIIEAVLMNCLISSVDVLSYKLVSRPAVDASTLTSVMKIVGRIALEYFTLLAFAPIIAYTAKKLINLINFYGLKYGYVRIESTELRA